MRPQSALLSLVFLVLVLATHGTGRLIAQTADAPGPTPAAPNLDIQPAPTPAPPAEVPEQPAQYAPALDGTGLIPLDALRNNRLLIGGTVSGIFDSNPSSLTTGQSTALYAFSPYLRLQASTARTQYLLQYEPTITRYGQGSGATMHIASVKVLGSLSPRWAYHFDAIGDYGQDSVRFLSPSQSVAVGAVPGTGPSSSSYLPNAGLTTNIGGGLGFHFDKSARDGIDFDIANSFSRVSGPNSASSVANGDFIYTHGLSPTLGLIAYGQTASYLIGRSCTTFGGGLGLRWHLLEKSELQIKGGPEIDTPGCRNQQGFSYNALFSTRITGHLQVYLLANRQPVTAYLGPGLWQDGASGGLQRSIGLRDVISIDAGYVSSNTLTRLSSYNGRNFDASYIHTIRRGLAASATYRGYLGSAGTSDFTRNVFTVSITITPNPRSLFQ